MKTSGGSSHSSHSSSRHSSKSSKEGSKHSKKITDSSEIKKKKEKSGTPETKHTPPAETSPASETVDGPQTKEDMIEHIHELMFAILSEIQQFRLHMESPILGFTVQSMAVKVVGEAKSMGQATLQFTEKEKAHVSFFHYYSI